MTTLFIIGGVLVALIAVLLISMFSIKFDETHTSSTESWHVKLYRALSWKYPDLDYENEWAGLPKTICNYFWSYLLYIVSIPLTIIPVVIGVFIKRSFKEGTPIYGLSLIINFIFLISFGIGFAIFDQGDTWIIHWAYAWLVGFGIALVIVAIFIGIIHLADYIDQKKRERNFRKYGYEGKPKKKSMIKMRFKAWKEKNCPIINWE